MYIYIFTYIYIYIYIYICVCMCVCVCKCIHVCVCVLPISNSHRFVFLQPDDLFETLAQCLLSGVDRDCLAGWGCVVHVLTPEGVTTRDLKGRMD